MANRFEHPAKEKKARSAKLLRELNKLRFLKSDLEYHRTEQAERKMIFDRDIMAYMKKNDVLYSPFKHKKNLIINEYILVDRSQSTTKATNKECKSLYKKIAKEAHPDVNLNKDEATQKLKESIFQKAKLAHDMLDWFTLYDCALELNLELPQPTDSQIEWLSDESERLERVVKLIESSYEWIYGEKQTKAEKESILIKYCLMFCYDKNN